MTLNAAQLRDLLLEVLEPRMRVEFECLLLCHAALALN